MRQSQRADARPDESRRNSWEEAWQLAVQLASEDLATRDLAECCRRAGATWHAPRQAVEVSFLGRSYELAPPDFAARLTDGDVADGDVAGGDVAGGDVAGGDVAGGDAEVDIRERILLLHYLQTAGGRAATGEWIAFSQMPGAELYLANFRARSADRIGRAFGAEPARLLEAVKALGGVKTEHGDAGARLEALPRVSVLVLVWGGDDEFPASGDVLFDGSVTDYLPLEDIVVTAEKVATRLCAPMRGMGK